MLRNSLRCSKTERPAELAALRQSSATPLSVFCASRQPLRGSILSLSPSKYLAYATMNIHNLVSKTAKHFFYYTDEIESAYKVLHQEKCSAIFTSLTRKLYEITRSSQIFQDDSKNIVPYFIDQYKKNIKAYEKCISDQEEINQCDSKNLISHYKKLISKREEKIQELRSEYPNYPQWSKLIGDWTIKNARGEEQYLFISRETFNVFSEATHCKANFLFNRYQNIIQNEFSYDKRLNTEKIWEKNKNDDEYFQFWMNNARDACGSLIDQENK